MESLRERGQEFRRRGLQIPKRAVSNLKHKMTMEKYEYAPLPSTGHIRLLKLHPVTNSKDTSLSVDLVPVLLDEAPEFEALSYAWGKPWPRYEICCAGRRIDIGSSLYGALWHMRQQHPGDTFWVWADAVCINQYDIAEREAQVSMMSEIYARASITVIWLGWDNEYITRAFVAIQRFRETWQTLRETLDLPVYLGPSAPAASDALRDVLSRDNNSESRRLLRDAFGDDKSQTKAMEDIWVLLRQPWFMRKWVIQEVDKSKHHGLVFMAGKSWTHWSNLSYWFQFLSMNLHARDTFFLACPWRTPVPKHGDIDYHKMFDRGSMLGQGSEYSTTTPICNLLIFTATFKCAVPSDHIISLLGIASDSSTLEGLIDYNISTDDLYCRLMSAHLDHPLKLRVLWSTLDMLSVEQRGKSSWIPNIEQLALKFPAFDNCIPAPGPYRLADACGSTEIEATTSGDTLLIRGRIIDAVEHLGRLTTTQYSETRRPLYDGDCSKRNKTTLRMWDDWLDECQTMAKSAGQDGQEFVKALLIDSLLGVSAEVTAAAKKDFFKYRQIQKSLVAVSDEKRALEIIESMTFELAKSVEVISAFIVNMQYRRFGHTRNDRLGWMPLVAEDGDQICVFDGMEFPYAVRKKEGPEGTGNYVLVGACYISSLLNGEAMELPGVESTIIAIE
ncbi:hypothetical protein KVR01_007624 [Diaporthe batatas]|uniref:uncharacterized protein n=1 Tax=Diaporthe batatas TaxID=748121 RepID=UPI001D051F40|nr:uncharacterized protein KVR01_007624 [Diaporthe batatas]KAG8163146.1 hypothetical protein KVR01_007624 [Diaporthe batatas]